MRSPGGSCSTSVIFLKNYVTSGVILKVNMSLFGCKLLSTCVSRSQWCRNVHSQGVYLIILRLHNPWAYSHHKTIIMDIEVSTGTVLYTCSLVDGQADLRLCFS